MTDPAPTPPQPTPPSPPSTPPPADHVSRQEFQGLQNDLRGIIDTVAAIPESVARAVREAVPQSPQPPAPQPPASNQTNQSQGGNNSDSSGNGGDSQTPGKNNRRKGARLFGMDLGF